MPFQAIPIALRKHTGSPLSKLLLIYLVDRCEVSSGGESAIVEVDAAEAAKFCQCDESAIFGALSELERLQLVWPDPAFVRSCRDAFKNPDRDRWEFVRVALPTSWMEPATRRRFKCADDQMDMLLERARYRCATCGVHDDDVERWHVDHIIPRSLGGADVEENCQVLCDRCNSRKGAKVHFVDFLGGRR